METQSLEEVKKLILTQLPHLMETEPEIRDLILRVTRDHYAGKQETESRFDRVMDELKQDREAQMQKWEAYERRWAAWEKKWEEEREAQEKKWEAQEQRWAAWEKKWEEEREAQERKWEAQEQRWAAWEKKWEEERDAQEKKWEAQEQRWAAWEKKWEEERDAQEKKWEENQRSINQILTEIRLQNQKYDSTIGALGARWGLHSESAFRNGLRAILERSFGVKVERYEDFDSDGNVFGRPEQIEMDVIVHNGVLILCEIKSSMSKSDLYSFWRKKNFYEEKHGRRASRTMVISPMIEDAAKSAAKELGIEVYGYAQDVKT